MYKNNLSTNLKAYQNHRNLSLSEFAAELAVPKNTLRYILTNGNTTLFTAIQISQALGTTIDNLVNNEHMPDEIFILKQIEDTISCLSILPPEKRRQIASLISDIFHVIEE